MCEWMCCKQNKSEIPLYYSILEAKNYTKDYFKEKQNKNIFLTVIFC